MKSQLISINSGLVERGLLSNKRCSSSSLSCPLGGSGPRGGEGGVHKSGEVDGKPSSLNSRPGQLTLWLSLRGTGWNVNWKVDFKGRFLYAFCC